MQGSSPHSAIVVPLYNEEKRFDSAAFRRFVSEHPGFRFVLVNDGSRDQTASLIRALAASDPEHFIVHELTANSGKAEAVRQGVLLATKMAVKFVGFYDADLATPLRELPELCRLLERSPETQAVLCSRVRLLGRDIRRKATRHYLGRAFATGASLLLGIAVYDTQCGAKLFRLNEPLVKIFSEPFQSRWIFDVEIIARMAKETGMKAERLAAILMEYPVSEWRDVKGSKIKSRDFAIAVLELFSLYVRYGRYLH